MSLRNLKLSETRYLPARFLSLRFAKSAGPGGQHVNKTSTKVNLRLDLDAARECFNEFEWARLTEKLAHRIDREGFLQVTSSETRVQSQNIELSVLRMEMLIQAALKRERPRKKTRPSRGAKERRLKNKRKTSERKGQRRAPVDD
ncbi:MAG: aminoacyl-tRNA hydrolase [Deltaproteobacteria bacterium]|nr:aminoacyl-tRNA hydrolase [Deltaproteobacteria bacterium]